MRIAGPDESTDFPRAILHIDGDAFFASSEVARRPELKGKPVVVGAERGIATALTYEAKALGVVRGMPISRIKRHFPDVVVLSGDYTYYSEISRRFNEVIFRYTPEIEPYSIDEVFANITGYNVPRKESYARMVATMKHELQSELNMTFSFGLAPTKALAKVASKHQKPDGLTLIPLSCIEEILGMTPIEKVWGIGRKTSEKLREEGVSSALQFIKKPRRWVESYFAKPYLELWRELRGDEVWGVHSGVRAAQKSYMHTRTFTPPTSDPRILLRELSKHAEAVARSAREDSLAAKKFTFFLKTQTFKYFEKNIMLLTPTNVPQDLFPLIAEHLDTVLREGLSYRATGVMLHDLIPERATTDDLFDVHKRETKLRTAYKKIDEMNDRFGRTLVSMATSAKKRTKKNVRSGDTTKRPEKAAARKQVKGLPFSVTE